MAIGEWKNEGSVATSICKRSHYTHSLSPLSVALSLLSCFFSQRNFLAPWHNSFLHLYTCLLILVHFSSLILKPNALSPFLSFSFSTSHSRYHLYVSLTLSLSCSTNKHKPTHTHTHARTHSLILSSITPPIADQPLLLALSLLSHFSLFLIDTSVLASPESWLSKRPFLMMPLVHSL